MAATAATTPATSTLHTLHRASGSATYVSPLPLHRPPSNKTQTSSSYESSTSPLTVTCGVNFPVEVARRSDELPEALLVEVNVRPARGVGQVAERRVEEVVRQTLRAVLCVGDWPRLMCQVGLQVIAGDDGEEEGQKIRYLGLVAGCVNAAVMGCLDAAVPMRTMVGAVTVGVMRDGEVVVQPDVVERRRTCTSLHVFGFTAEGGLVLAESEGRFTVEEWEKGEAVARRLVVENATGDVGTNGDQDELEGGSIIHMMRKSVEARVARDERWRGG